jgi:signal transduction histidine kinase
MKGLPEIEWMATDQILSVLRILQEALSNSVRHGKPTSITIIGAVAGGGKEASLVIENAGGQRFEQTTAGFGYGMKTMAQRAEEIGGRIILEPLSTGAVFTLVLPISKDVSAQEACGL